MSVIDIIILVPIVYGVIRGLMKGLVQELTTLVALAAGVIGAKLWSPTVAAWLGSTFTWDQRVSEAIAYTAVLLAITISLALVGKLITRVLQSVSLGGVNRLLGAIFGGLKLAIVAGILVVLFDFVDSRFQIIKPEKKRESVLYEPMKQLVGVAWDAVNPTTDEVPQLW